MEAGQKSYPIIRNEVTQTYSTFSILLLPLEAFGFHESDFRQHVDLSHPQTNILPISGYLILQNWYVIRTIIALWMHETLSRKILMNSPSMIWIVMMIRLLVLLQMKKNIFMSTWVIYHMISVQMVNTLVLCALIRLSLILMSRLFHLFINIFHFI